MDKVATIDDLLNRAQEVERKASEIQADAKMEPDESSIREMRNTYQDWFAESLAVLPDDLESAFRNEYSGGRLSPKIRAFLSSPRQLGILRPTTGTEPEIFPVSRWQHPFERSFREPFSEQVALLRQARARLQHSSEVDNVSLNRNDLYAWHPQVQAAALSLFRDGHYRQAILQACLALTDAVKAKSNRYDLDNTPLMQQVFSKNGPILRYSTDQDEQQGIMFLFSGATMAIRNPRAHKQRGKSDEDIDNTVEWLGFISALFRILDECTLEKSEE